MSTIIDKIKENKKTIIMVLTILILPLFFMLIEIGMVSIFNLGTYVGTFIRNVFQIVG